MKALKLKWLIGLILISNFVAGCAFDLAHVDFKTVTISSCSENCPTFKISTEKLLTDMPCGYERTIKQDSEWSMIGKIEAGDVYKPLNQCFTIECSNVFEAYLVMNGRNLNGFYLPVEDGFVALEKPVELEIK
jgi:hypothetical protein